MEKLSCLSSNRIKEHMQQADCEGWKRNVKDEMNIHGAGKWIGDLKRSNKPG